MPQTVTINLEDLRKLVKLLFTCSIQRRAQRTLRAKQVKFNKAVVRAYLEAVLSELPDARKSVRTDYRELFAALKDGSDVRRALANFVVHEAKSSTASDTKARRIP